MMVIDFHTHIFPEFFRGHREDFFAEEPAFELLYRSPSSKLVGRETLLGHMDEKGVQKAVIFGFPWTRGDYFRRHNDYILETVERYRDRLIGFGCFSPLSPEGPREAERCLESGLSGLGELAFYASDIDPSVLGEIMALARRFDVPVLLHTNEPVGHDYPGKTPMTLRRLYGLLKANPDNKVVLAHWGGGLFFYALMNRDVRDVLKNTWFDTAATPYLYSPKVYRIACEIIGPQRVLLGSDYPLLSPGRYFKDMAFADLPEPSRQLISGINAARLLGISL